MPSDWINDFVSYTEGTGSPEIFRKWGALSIISAALERKVWNLTRGSRRYPNIYVILCGPAGVGKTEVTWRARDFIRGLKTHFVSPSSITSAGLADKLKEANRAVVRENEIPATVLFNSLYVVSNEMAVLLPAYDSEFMHILTDLWDCKSFEQKRRHMKEEISLQNPQLSLLAATTPQWVMTTLPEAAWDQGFTSRTIFVFSGESQVVDLFDVPEENETFGLDLQARLMTIGQLYGEVHWSEGAREVIRRWQHSGMQPAPEHPRLFAYLARRLEHAVKISTCVMISETSALEMKAEHVQRAIDLLVEAEAAMPEIFKLSGGTTHSRIIEDTYHYIARVFLKENKRPVAATRVYAFVGQRVPAYNVLRVLEVMEKSGTIRKMLETYGDAYIPMGKQE